MQSSVPQSAAITPPAIRPPLHRRVGRDVVRQGGITIAAPSASSSDTAPGASGPAGRACHRPLAGRVHRQVGEIARQGIEQRLERVVRCASGIDVGRAGTDGVDLDPVLAGRERADPDAQVQQAGAVLREVGGADLVPRRVDEGR